MIRSMTGYGRSGTKYEAHDISIEIKSVNHRFLDLNFRMPGGFNELEMILRDKVKSRLVRGSVTVFLNLISDRAKNSTTINEQAVISYKEELDNLADKAGLKKIDNIESLLRLPDIFKESSESENKDIYPYIVETLENALTELINYREQEGSNLEKILSSKIEILTDIIKEVDELSGSASEIQYKKLLERLEKQTDIDSFNNERLEQELVMISDKVDISEEISRLYSHFDLFLATIAEDKPVGKVLNNIAQEMHREASTISAKTNLTGISHLSVKMKEIIEIIREQVQNVE